MMGVLFSEKKIILTPLCMVFPMTCEWNSVSFLFLLNTLNSHQLLCFLNCINTWNRGSSNKLLSGLLSMLLHLQEWEYHQFVGFFYMDHQGARRLHLLRLLLMLLKLLFSPWGNFDLSLLNMDVFLSITIWWACILQCVRAFNWKKYLIWDCQCNIHYILLFSLFHNIGFKLKNLSPLGWVNSTRQSIQLG